jgi:hypothetical protein
MVRQSDIDKTLRRVVSAVLRDSGFESVSARKSWAWRHDCVWNLTIRGVGGYFSGRTGWPSASLTVWVAVYYPFIPFRGHTPPKLDQKGRLTPSEGHGHFRSHLERSLDQAQYTDRFDLPQERSRRDIWWVGDDEEKLLPVAADIASAIVEQGRPWFARRTDLAEAFRELEAEHDCLDKFYRAKHFAEHLGLSAKVQQYGEQLKAEARRIGFPEDGRWPLHHRTSRLPKHRSS